MTWFSKRFERILPHMKKYAVLLVDDHRILLEGMKNLLQEPYEVKATASSGQEALELIKNHDFDVLITDYEMPGINGLDLVKAMSAAQPEAKVIVLSMHDDPSVVRELFRAGASGYILKKDTYNNLTAALQKVTEGKRFMSDAIAEMLINDSHEETNGPLTPREIEILKLVTREMSSKQIAEILFISERTVETHRKNILKKTGSTNLAGLVKYAYVNNLIK
jgi:two-component system, NarL family, nitrate/nitrite response regulator NarL